ncbi:MAG: efflux RND transporter periplasmic adaptor subunit [Verrucomicrobia bacterium]|nr:efflux RND transporter periplasmic adaptor subunit [Verrucomicrobiota bacterium]
MKLRLLLLPAFVLASCGPPQGPPQGGAMPPAQVTLGAVETRRLVEREEFTGRVEATEMVELRPRVSGYITGVHFEAGALVKEGDILFTIDQRAFETRLRAAKADVSRAEAASDMSKREFDRVNQLLAARAIAPEQAESRESAWLQSQAVLEAASAALHSAAIEMEHTEVKAPISGRISRAITTTGNFVTAGTTLLTTIVTVDPVYVYTDIDEQSLLRLQAIKREGNLYVDEKGRVPVEVQLANETDFPHRGFIESFDNRLDAATGSMVVRCELPNADGQLTPGLFTRVRLPMTSEYDALLVEAEAILTDQANKYVLGVTPANLTVYKPVVIGPAIDGKRIIRSGLAAGEKIIINGMARLPQPGMPVQPVEAPPGGAAGSGNAPKP